MESEYDVIIVGGGIAAISTAYHLVKRLSSSPPSDSSIKRILLLEARDRLGGRIHAATLDSCTVELGANWIHGTIGNPVCDIAARNGLVNTANCLTGNQESGADGEEYVIHAIREDGQRLDDAVVRDVVDLFPQFTERLAAYHTMPLEAHEMSSNSAGQQIIRDTEKHLDTVPHGNERKLLFKSMLQREAIYCGSDTLNDVSLRDYGAYQELEGGGLTIAPTHRFSDIIRIMMDEVHGMIAQSKGKPHLEVLTSKEVIKVKYMTESSDTKDNRCEVTCRDGSVFSCRQVVVTLPLGVLKDASESLFEPRLSEGKMHAIRCLGFAAITKVYMEFNEALAPKFLDPKVNEILLLWEDQEASRNGREITLKQGSPDAWHRTMYSLTKVSGHCLMGWLSGVEAQVVELMDEREVARVMAGQVLRKFLHPEFPEPQSITTSKWMSDPFTKGAYTFISTTSSVRDIETLSQPVCSKDEKPVLLFAGEACHAKHFATTHGAFMTGEKAASSLLDFETESG